MVALQGITERKMRAMQVDASSFSQDLYQSLGPDFHNYVNAYGPGGEFYNPDLNMQAARSYNLPAVRPARFTWFWYSMRGYASIEAGQFRWLPPSFPAYA